MPATADVVTIRATVEDMIGCVEYEQIPAAEWDAMTPTQRQRTLDRFGSETMTQQGGYGAGIESGAPDSDLDGADQEREAALNALSQLNVLLSGTWVDESWVRLVNTIRAGLV